MMPPEKALDAVDLMERHVEAYPPIDALEPQWAARFDSLRRRWTRAICADARREARLAAMAGRHESDEANALFAHAGERLLACCRALEEPVRARDDKTARWDAVMDLTTWPKPDSALGETDKLTYAKSVSERQHLLREKLDAIDDDAIKEMGRQAMAEVAEAGPAKWRDEQELAWIGRVLPERCDLGRAPTEPAWQGVRDGPRGASKRLRDVGEFLNVLLAIRERVGDGDLTAFDEAAQEARAALDGLRAFLETHKELNEIAYYLWVERAGYRGAALAWACIASNRIEVEEDVRHIRRLTEWLTTDARAEAETPEAELGGPQMALPPTQGEWSPPMTLKRATARLMNIPESRVTDAQRRTAKRSLESFGLDKINHRHS